MILDNIASLAIATILPMMMFALGFGYTSFNKKMEKDALDRQKQTVLIMRILKVLGENDQELFEALENGRTNGNLDRARGRLRGVLDDLDAFLIEKASREE